MSIRRVETQSEAARRRCLETEPVIRFVVTHLDKKTGLRTLAHPAQGAHTYATQEEAQAWIDAAMRHTGERRLNEIYGLPLRAVPCPCWPTHFDPKTIFPEESSMPRPEHTEKSAEEFEKRLLDIAWSAVCKVTEVYKRHPRRAPDELDRLKMLENVEQELGILREGGPHL